MEILDKLNLASTEVKIKGKGSVVLPEVAEDNVNYVVGVDSEGKANVDKISFLKDLKSTDPTLSGNSEFYKSVSIDKEEGNLSVINKYYNELTGLRTEDIAYISNDEIVITSKDNESGDSETHIFSDGVVSTGGGIFLCSIFSPFIVAGYDLDDAGGPTGNVIIINPDGFSVGNVDNNEGASFIFDRSKTTTSSSTYTIATTEDIPDAYTKTEVDEKIPTNYLPVIALDANGDLVSDTGNSPASYKLHEGFLAYGPLKTFSQTDFIGPVTFEIYPESTCSLAFTKETQLVTKKYVDDSICTATNNLVTKSIQSPAQSSGTWTVSLDSNYTSAPFVQVFDGENKIVFPSIKFVAPNSLEIEFDGKDSIAQGEFTAVISTPFTSTVELDETVVTINSDQGISGVKNFTGTLQYQGSEVAKKSEIPSLNGYATEDFVANCINAVEIPDVSSFITKDVDNLTNYTKTTELVSDYAKKTDLNGLATQQYVDDKVEEIDIPEINEFISLADYGIKGTCAQPFEIEVQGELSFSACTSICFYVTNGCNFVFNVRSSTQGIQVLQETDSGCYISEITPNKICSYLGNFDQVQTRVLNTCSLYSEALDTGSINTCCINASSIDVTGTQVFKCNLPEYWGASTVTSGCQLTTKEYVDDKVDSATQHLKTKSYQSVETTEDKWTITLDSEYSSAPFFQVFNSENSIVYPEVKFTAPSTLELTFEGKEGIGLGEFTAVVSVPFTTTITPNESYVSIGTAQGISGKKNFTTVPTINSVDIATVDNLSTTENSVRSYVDTEISAKIASVYRFKGDSTYASLPDNAQVGDVYNLTTASGEYKIGDNVAWTGSKWDKLAATVDLSGYLTTSSASSTYLTISSASSTYATKDKTIDISDTGTQYMSGTLCLSNTYACVSAPYLLARGSIYVGAPDSENDTSYFYGPVEFKDTVSVSELEIDSLFLETLEIGNEINVNGIAISESISNLNAKTGSLEYVLPAKTVSNGVAEWEITINTDLTKTVKCPPNVIVCDITGERYKYVVCDVEWDGANKIYIKFDNNGNIEDNQFKAYITNIQLQ